MLREGRFVQGVAVHRKGCSSVRTLPSTPSPSPNLFFLSAYNLFPLSLYTLKIMCTHFPYHNIFPAPSLAVFISLFSFSPLSFSMIHASTMTNSLSLSLICLLSLSFSLRFLWTAVHTHSMLVNQKSSFFFFLTPLSSLRTWQELSIPFVSVLGCLLSVLQSQICLLQVLRQILTGAGPGGVTLWSPASPASSLVSSLGFV